MSLEKESLLENLNLIYRLKEQAESLRKESDMLLYGMRDILEADSSQALYEKMFAMFGSIIPFRYCFLLVPSGPKQMLCSHATHADLTETEWHVDDVIQKALDGEPIAVFNNNLQPAWQAHRELNLDTRSIMYCPLREETHTSVIVFCAKEIGFYTQKHVAIAQRYRDFTEQTILSVKAKLQALASEQLRKEKELVEKSMIQSEKMASLGLLAAGVAHEINNPIGFVKSNIEFLGTYTPLLKQFMHNLNEVLNQPISPDEKLAKLERIITDDQCDEVLEDFSDMCEEMKDGVDRVSEIVKSLQSFVHKGKQDEQQAFDINQCIVDSLRVVHSKLRDNIRVTQDLASLSKAQGNPGKLNQVLVNLFVNASHAMPEGGELYVATSPKDDETFSITIRDTGVGIPAGKLAKIFEPFYTTKDVGEGTGLGLYISFTLIKAMQGDIQVTSELDVGTTFIITLPKANN